MRRVLTRGRRKRIEKAARGSITILLVIVLVPVVSVAGLFVDASRYQLARSEVAAAADLTLNAALADYDTILKDVYGLFAVSQSEDDLQSKLQTYFTNMLIDTKIASDSEEVKNNPLLQNVIDASTGETSNLLALTMDDDGISFSGVSGSSLAKADVLKNEIVEYCKYRTPVNAAFSIIEGIKAISKTGKQMQVTQKQAEADEAMEDLNKACKELYKKTKEYQDIDKSMLRSGDNYDGKSYKKNYIETIVPTAIQKMITPDSARAWAKENSSKRSGYEVDSSTVSFTQSTAMRNNDKDRMAEECASMARMLESSSTPSYINGRNYTSLSTSEKVSYVESFETYMEDVYRLWRVYEKYLSVAYPNSSELSNYKNGDGKRYQDLLKNAVNLTTKVNQGISDSQNSFDSAESTLQGLRNDYVAKVNLLNEMKGKLKECVDKAKDVETKVAEVRAKNDSFGTALTNYKSDGSDSFSSQMDSAYNANAGILDEDNFKKFQTRLSTLKSYSDQMYEHFKAFRFLDKDLESYNTLDSIIDRFSYASMNGTSVRNYAEQNSGRGAEVLARDIVNALFLCAVDAPSSVELSIEDEPFYRYLKLTFAQDEKSSDDENTLNNLRDSAESGSSDSTSTEGLTGASISSMLGENSPSNGGSGEGAESVDASGMSKDKYSGMLSNMSGLVNELLAGIGNAMTAARDNLYIMDYAFSMFSWYTQENEYVKDGKGKTPQTPSAIAINSTNNKIYRAEVEYILYGKDTASANVATAKAYIFAIRFACNSIHALTDGEINSVTLPPALAIQTASAGVIPYKIPQVVMKLALALAESVADMVKLNNGEAVPLLKNDETFTMKPSGLLKAAKDGAVNLAGEAITGASEGLKNSLNSLLDSGADKVEGTVEGLANSVSDAAKEQANQAVDSMFGSFTTSLQLSVSRLTTSLAESANSAAGRIVDEAKAAARSYVDQQNSGSVHGALSSAYQTYIEGRDSEIRNLVAGKITELQSAADGKAGEIIEGLQTSIKDKVTGWIESARDSVVSAINGEIDSLTSRAKEKLSGGIDNASAEMRKGVASEINDWFDSNFGQYTGSMGSSSSSGAVSSGAASLLQFKYSDYLKIFLYIKLCINPDEHLLRIADLIELNIKTAGEGSDLVHSCGADFSMSKAYTYYELDATVGLNTMFLDMPLITQRMGKQGISSFPLTYKGAQGY